MPYKLDGRTITPGRPFVHPDGRQFSGGWYRYTSDELTSLGITWEADPAYYDEKYYINADTPRPLDDDTSDAERPVFGVRPVILASQKQEASNRLRDTDWYVLRKADAGTAVPDAVTTYRTAVRTVCATREAEIAAVKTTQELEALMKAPDKILDTDNETLIDNPAAHLTPWPELAE